MPQALTKGDLATITELRAKFTAQSTAILRDLYSGIFPWFFDAVYMVIHA